ncbi:MAG: single-stranded-DNA-specific exonuclease RecJ [Chitinispirillaceae bacterium]|nr:single-stranded-DNA-specific exonuclease RecJ [Chitinispirillaceae bacterium]
MNAFAGVRERICVRAVDEEIVSRLSKELGVPPAGARILACRDLADAASCRKFFAPSLDDLRDPFLFAGMEKAVSRIAAAVSGKKKIAVYGDYDADGVTGTAMLVRTLRSLGAECMYYLPNRLTEGYGVSESGVRQIAGAGAALVITVDCGITAEKETALAASLGMEVIVTDHHEPKAEGLPHACCILNPKAPLSGYPEKDLAGVGVVLKLCQALGEKTGRGEALWKPYLDLAALGTAADVVPLTGENRILARAGFEQLRRTKNKGLAALIRLQGLEGKPVSTNEAAFQLAPCINAAGRLGDPRRSVELLLADDEATALEYAKTLRTANDERRAIDTGVREEAESWVNGHCDPRRDFAIVAGSAGWHAGVVGIVASKIAEKFHRPVILFSLGKNGSARGSGRSIPGFNLLDALRECSSFLESFGGHAAAAGVNIQSTVIDAFRTRFNEVARARLRPEDLVPTVYADAEVPVTALTPQLFSLIKTMEPFGQGNARPVFCCRNLSHRYAPRIVGGNHLKMSVADDGKVFDAIGFNFGDRIGELSAAPSLTLAFSLDENEWNGRKSLQMKVRGIVL